MARKNSREVAFKLVFEYCLTKEKNEFSLNELVLDEKLGEDKQYIQDIYFGVIDKFDELCVEIEKHSQGFAFERIYKIDLAIMLVALFEVRFYKIPKAVAINEAVNLAKTYSTEKSATFVNGVLATMVGENV